MTLPCDSATNRVFATPELLEQILLCLTDRLLPLTVQEDPRSVRTLSNAKQLYRLLRCSQVGRPWRQCMQGSKRVQRVLFQAPDDRTQRSWDFDAEAAEAALNETSRRHLPHRAPSNTAPTLNPMLQITFPSYHFRFWHLSLEASGNKHCAYMIITRRDMPGCHGRKSSGQGRSISEMLLAQPPCTALEASIWEERDETKDYVGRTNSLDDPLIKCDAGLTMGFVHERVCQMFDAYGDVAAIKLTTV